MFGDIKPQINYVSKEFKDHIERKYLDGKKENIYRDHKDIIHANGNIEVIMFSTTSKSSEQSFSEDLDQVNFDVENKFNLSQRTTKL